MTYMRSWKSHRLTSHTWLGLNPQIGRPLSRIVVPLVYFIRKKDLRLATWNVRSLYRPGGLRITINELRKYKIAIAAIQETMWNKMNHKP
jgi:hypothetical protein